MMINRFEVPTFRMWLTYRQGDKIVREILLDDLIVAPAVGEVASYSDPDQEHYYNGIVAHRRVEYAARDGRVFTTVHILADIQPRHPEAAALVTEATLPHPRLLPRPGVGERGRGGAVG